MKLGDLKAALREHPDKNVGFILPDGDPVPADFHVTEVGHVIKNFIDCGGTKRSTETMVLQAWVAKDDPDHRLTAGRLGAILELAKSVVPSDDLDVEVEYEGCAISQYPLSGFAVEGAEVKFNLAEKHADCLAREACGLDPCGGGPAEAQGKCC